MRGVPTRGGDQRATSAAIANPASSIFANQQGYEPIKRPAELVAWRSFTSRRRRAVAASRWGRSPHEHFPHSALDRPGGHAGMAVTAVLDDDEYVVNGRKYWPCSFGC